MTEETRVGFLMALGDGGSVRINLDNFLQGLLGFSNIVNTLILQDMNLVIHVSFYASFMY